MIAVIDYGAGNIFSVKNALDFIGYENRLTDKKEDIENADAIMLFEKSYEFEECSGLGLLKGKVDRIDEPDLVIPHMGWNKLVYNHDCPLFDGLTDDEYVYFVHSYKAFCDDKNLYAYCEYGNIVPALVSDGRYIYGAQFHPEKSGKTGLKLLENFAGLSGEVK